MVSEIQALSGGIRRVSYLLCPISQAGFKATAGDTNWRIFPAHFSQREAEPPSPQLGRKLTDKCRKGLLLRQATASEVVCFESGIWGLVRIAFYRVPMF